MFSLPFECVNFGPALEKILCFTLCSSSSLCEITLFNALHYRTLYIATIGFEGDGTEVEEARCWEL